MTLCEARSSTSLGEWRTRGPPIGHTTLDVEDLLPALEELSSREVGVVIEVETELGFRSWLRFCDEARASTFPLSSRSGSEQRPDAPTVPVAVRGRDAVEVNIRASAR
jgi:hypothetical protein